MTQFGRVSLYQDNPGSASFPSPTDDATQGWVAGSRWYDTRMNVWWVCQDATAGAAKWAPSTTGVLAKLIGANMNSTADQVFATNYDLTLGHFALAKILVTNASLSLTTAVGGIYGVAAKGGTPWVAAAQAYSTLTLATSLLSLTIAAFGSGNVFAVAPILSLTTPQGAAATADFYMIGDIIPAG